MAKQGQWTNWVNLEKRKLSWRNIWEMEGPRVSFLIRGTYDLLPTPQNLSQWLGEDPACSPCQAPASLRCWVGIFPVEEGCRGFVSTSTTSLLMKMGVRGRSLQQAIKSRM